MPLYLWFYVSEDPHNIDHCLIVTKTKDQTARDETYEEARSSIGASDVALQGVARLEWEQGDGDDMYMDHGHIG